MSKIYNCPNCHKFLAYQSHTEPVIRCPFIVCAQCQSSIYIPFYKEWEEFPLGSKIGQFGLKALGSAACGFFVGILYGPVSEKLHVPYDFLLISLIATVLFFALSCISEVKKIRFSQQRMRDPAYRARVLEAASAVAAKGP